MLLHLALPLLVLHLWFPVLLLAKASNRPSEKTQFLLHYWLWYLALTYIHFYILLSLLPLQGILDLMFAVFKIWLFYGHGCVLLLSYYLPRTAFATTGWASVVDMEAGLIDPVVLTFIIRNPVWQKIVYVLEKTGFFGFASGIFSFSHELCRLVSWPKRPLCLHLGAEFFCYMDSPKELAQRLQNVERFLFGLKAAVSPATSPAARRVSSRHKHHTSSRVDYSDYESDSFLLRQSELYTPARSNPLSPTALSPTALSPKTLSPVGGDSGVSPLVKKTRRRPPNDGRVVSADHATGRVISADNTAERRRFRSISVGSIDETALPYPLDDPAPPTDPLNVLSKPRGD